MRFSAAQQQEYENLLAREWPNPANRKSLVEMVHGLDRLSSVPEEKKRQLHDQIQQTMLESMHKNSQSEDSRWLLAVYDSAHERSVTEGSVPVAAGRIYGKWRESKASSVQYGNRTTGALAPTNGSTYFYEFAPDGTYKYDGLMQVTTYGCSTHIYNQDSGAYHLNGDVLTLEPAQGSVKVTQNCGTTGDTQKPASREKRELRIDFEQQGNGTVLVMNNVAGTARPDYFRPER